MKECSNPCPSRAGAVCPGCREEQEKANALREVRDESASDFVGRVVRERDALRENLAAAQDRSSVLLNKARAWRLKIIELGGEDPGSP